MFRAVHRRCWRIAGLLLLCAGVPAALAADSDGDGIADTTDICNNTPAGTPVDYWGRPYADFDQDCDVDAADFEFFAASIGGTPFDAGPALPLNGDADADGVENGSDICDNTPAGVVVDHWGRPYADFDHNCAVDLRDYAFFQIEYTGPLSSCVAGQPCDDGLDCTVNDQCVAAVCRGTPVDALCDDDVYCNGIETCDVLLGCVAGVSVDCSDLDGACQAGVCDEDTDSCLAAPANEGEACEDGLFCTVGETCQAGVCGNGAARDCSAFDDQCNVGVCNEMDMTCEAQPAYENEACDDGLFCTTGETCAGGACTGGSPTDCSFLDGVCRFGVCDEETDACEVELAAYGTACDDGNDCTVGDICSSGVCLGTAVPDQTLCDDGDPLTEDSYCVDGQCLEVFTYLPSASLSYSCPPGGLSFNVGALELADDGQTLTVFGAPAVMRGNGGLGPNVSFSVAGSITVGPCTQTYLLDGQFGSNLDSFVGDFRAEFDGCGPCGWPSWTNMTFTRQ